MIRLGDVEIRRIEELMVLEPVATFAGWQPHVAQEEPWLVPNYYDAAADAFVTSIASWLVKTPEHTILIDTGSGNHKERPLSPRFHQLDTPWLDRLEAAGAAPKDIDLVLLTHLHVDHVGWNTRLDNGRWVPTFPKAKYIMADRELAHWTAREKENPASFPWITDSVLPIVAAKREQIVKSDFVFNDQVRLIPTPGHTIDHFAVLVGQAGRDAFITGDMIHSPLQGKYPELGMFADYDSAQAGKTRRKVFDQLCEQDTVIYASHFPAPSTSQVRRWVDGFSAIKTCFCAAVDAYRVYGLAHKQSNLMP
jgi:glyoxylase-like metal-dependent hydrolase (beta-lactamase superfamily II)